VSFTTVGGIFTLKRATGESHAPLVKPCFSVYYVLQKGVQWSHHYIGAETDVGRITGKPVTGLPVHRSD